MTLEGVGTELVQWAVSQTRVFESLIPDDSRLVLQAFSSQEDGQRLLSDHGFAKTRESHIMRTDLPRREISLQ